MPRAARIVKFEALLGKGVDGVWNWKEIDGLVRKVEERMSFLEELVGFETRGVFEEGFIEVIEGGDIAVEKAIEKWRVWGREREREIGGRR